MSRLRFAWLIQALFLLNGAGLLLFTNVSGSAFDSKTPLLILGSLLLALIFLLRCKRCGASLFRTKNYPINLLVPANRICPQCQTVRE